VIPWTILLHTKTQQVLRQGPQLNRCLQVSALMALQGMVRNSVSVCLYVSVCVCVCYVHVSSWEGENLIRKITSHFLLFHPSVFHPTTLSPSSSYLLPFKQKGNRGHTKIERDDIHQRFGIKWQRLVPVKSSEKKQTSNQQSCLWCVWYIHIFMYDCMHTDIHQYICTHICTRAHIMHII
jgi:hypothetical protein